MGRFRAPRRDSDVTVFNQAGEERHAWTDHHVEIRGRQTTS